MVKHIVLQAHPVPSRKGEVLDGHRNGMSIINYWDYLPIEEIGKKKGGSQQNLHPVTK